MEVGTCDKGPFTGQHVLLESFRTLALTDKLGKQLACQLKSLLLAFAKCPQKLQRQSVSV